MSEKLANLEKKGGGSGGVTSTTMRYQIMSGTGDYYWGLTPPPFKYIKLTTKNASVSAVSYSVDGGTYNSMTLNTEYDVSSASTGLSIKLTKINSGGFAYIDVEMYN